MTILWGKDSQASGLSAESVRSASRERGDSLTRVSLLARGRGVGSSPDYPRVYRRFADEYDDLYLSAEPSYRPKSTFSERVAEISLCGFILLALISLLAGKI